MPLQIMLSCEIREGFAVDEGRLTRPEDGAVDPLHVTMSECPSGLCIKGCAQVDASRNGKTTNQPDMCACESHLLRERPCHFGDHYVWRDLFLFHRQRTRRPSHAFGHVKPCDQTMLFPKAIVGMLAAPFRIQIKMLHPRRGRISRQSIIRKTGKKIDIPHRLLQQGRYGKGIAARHIHFEAAPAHAYAPDHFFLCG